MSSLVATFSTLELYFTKIKSAHTREHFKENNTLNTHQLNIFSNLLFLHWVKNGKAPVFLSKFFSHLHHYPTSFSRNNYIVLFVKLTNIKYRITIRTPKLWNTILKIEKKNHSKITYSKAAMKTKLVLLQNAIVNFWCIYKTLSSLTNIFWKINFRGNFRRTYQGLADKTCTVFCKFFCQLSYFTFFQRKNSIL